MKNQKSNPVAKKGNTETRQAKTQNSKNTVKKQAAVSNENTEKKPLSIHIEELQAAKNSINSQLNELKEIERAAKKQLREANKKAILSGRELKSNWEDEFKNPFKLYNFYAKNIELIREREKTLSLPLLSKEQFFELFDGAKENKRAGRLALLEEKKKDAISLNDSAKVNRLDKQIIKIKALPLADIKLPFTLHYLLKLIK